MKKGNYMYLKQLDLVDTESDVVIKRVAFTLGANFVVDQHSSQTHNKVGKTTFLGLIDVAMGANDRSKLYKDHEGVINTTLEDLIHSRKIAVELILAEGDREYVLSVDLFSKGRYRINGKRFSQDKYRKELNKIIFQNPNEHPSLRELIPAFVRIELGKDEDKLLKHLSSFTSHAEYHAIYGFLFKIADPKLAKDISDAKREIRAIDTAIEKFKAVVDKSDPGVVEQILQALKRERSETESELSDILDPNDFMENRRSILVARENYMEILREIGDLQYSIDRLNASLREAEAESYFRLDGSLAERFFDEVRSLVPDIQKSLEDMVSFNRALTENKKQYLATSLTALETELSVKQAELEEFKSSKKRLLTLLQDDEAVENYALLLSRLRILESRIGEQEEVLKTFQDFINTRRALEKEIDALSIALGKNAVDPAVVMGEFNDIFTPIAKRVNGDSPILTYNVNPEVFPVKFENLEGSSTGTRKSLAAAYDLSYQKFARKKNLAVPHFIVHDVVENIEGEDFKKIVEIAEELKVQYVVAVLQEKLDSSEIDKSYQEEHTIIRLSLEDRLFGD